MAQVVSNVFLFKCFAHNSYKVVMIRSPLWNKHLVDLVVYASLFVVLPAKMSVVDIHEGFWKVEMLGNKFVVRLDFIDCVDVEGNFK
jgi:hypothetical protein